MFVLGKEGTDWDEDGQSEHGVDQVQNSELGTDQIRINAGSFAFDELELRDGDTGAEIISGKGGKIILEGIVAADPTAG